MSKTVLYVLLKVLMLARADILSMDPDSDFIQDSPVYSGDNYDIYERYFVESILSKPISPRAFVEFHNEFLNDDISITLRQKNLHSQWNLSEFTDEVIQGYTVRFWFTEKLKEIQICDDKSISATILECTVHNLKPNTTYYFQVRAHYKVGADPYTDLIDVSTTHENPIPQLLLVTDDGIHIWDLDLNISVYLVKDLYIESATYSIAEHKIYWSNKEKDLMMLEINENSITKIAKLQEKAYNLCIDWVARNLYWIEIDEHGWHIIKFDLTMWENGIVKYDKILKTRNMNHDRSFLNILPSIGTLYWTNYTENYEAQIIQSDLDGKNARIFQKNISVCLFTVDMSRFTFMKIDDINTNKPLIYWLLDNLLFVTDINVSMCNLILRAENNNFQSLAIDKTNIYIKFNNDYIYVLEKMYVLKNVDASKYIQKIKEPFRIHKLYAFGESLQSYPSTRCLTPDKKNYNIEVLMVTANSIIINLTEPVPKSGCGKYSLPTTLYTINISYCLDNELNKFDNIIVQTFKRYYEISNLTPLTEYKLLLIISNFYSDQLSMNPLSGSEVILKTKPGKLEAPKNVKVEALTPTVAAVYWMPPKKLNCVPVIYEVYWTLITNKTRQKNELPINKTEHKVGSKFFTRIEPLIPGQKYEIYVRIYLLNYSELYTDSLSKTLYMYSEPNDIILSETSITSMIISWIPPINLTIDYVLEYKNFEIIQQWQIVNGFKLNNGIEVMYYLNKLPPETRLEFRLRLKYPKYEKDFIWPSNGRFIFSTLPMSDISSSSGIYQYIISGLVAMVIVIFICYYLYRRRNKNNKQVLSPIMTDNELAILQEMPKCLTVQFNMSNNPVLQYDPEQYVLIKITREQIKLEKLLGSGAFGMVFRGTVKNLERPDIELPAAIKMLRKNASSNEKNKFLEEARLMNHFRHKHVLRLLAVCIDEDSPLIVLELMEIGDLLQYLRDSRKLQPSDSHVLRLQDLFVMCEDVARGCCYLENLRFVHRDLACRNCLVSARDRENRVIKIGDFGLARDVYKADYYRVKGQGRLPVCWMAPESLLIGIFTSQSDVWSFGILMWEITSLGEHPYTGRSNLEVIDYVRAGDRLSTPLNCPPTLYELMLRCWSPANNRPNFKFCLENIIALRNNIEDTLLSPMDIM